MERIDKLVTQRGLANSRERAQMMIHAGLVVVNGKIIDKVGEKVDVESDIVVTGEALAYVGRGGLKLEAALKMFRINASKAVCLDVGASTGGFTDCLLQRGAERVVAVDVGHGQLAAKLVNDPRIELREGVNARYLSPEQFDSLFDIAVIDVSFISLTLILPAVDPLVRPGGHILALIKPEFEAGRENVGAGGVVRDPEARKRCLHKVTEFGNTELGLEVRGTMQAPVTAKNKEYMVCFRKPLPESEVAEEVATA